ncbi:unnamed protein product [Peniophora sp. CBMAI 1063]|nr:unnamed protein product [Peniophora sp. CBMAI 1063]
MSTNIFESSRLAYRGAMTEDFDDVFAWSNLPEQQLGAHGGDLVPKDAGAKERARTRFKEEARPLYVLAVEKDSGEVVGAVSLRNGTWRMEYEIGLGVKKEFWGKGYATEMTTWVVQHAFLYMTGVHRIKVAGFSSNPAAIAVYKKVGFVQEGVTRRARYSAGKWDDVIELALVEDEWRNRLKLEESK